uniref:Endonuclease/exonuclease/phosphatase domain-containing protein n=1 Tax=Rhizochromulina marina TaxID=1034831 RepID=A0A7S2S644_9STRA
MGGKAGKYGWKLWLGICAAVFLTWALLPTPSSPQDSPEVMRALTWNMAAINNNPFEYWITSDDKTYNKLMEDVSIFINSPGDKDVRVDAVFTPAMFEDLMREMEQANWGGLTEVRQRWESEYRGRKIISEFIKDPVIGKKRLASMPDRYTNTINTADGKTVMRPTIINCYEGDLGEMNKWWAQWKEFVFHTSVTVESRDGTPQTKAVKDMLSPIKKSKYPAITPEEEAISIPLQTVAGAIFDGILVHMLNQLAPRNWQSLRKEMCDKLNRKKNDRSVDILQTTYKDVDIQFLQEVAGVFINVAQSHDLGRKFFDVYAPEELDGDRDQNSLILLKRGTFTNVREVTAEVYSHFEGNHAGKKLGTSAGDLFVVTCERTKTGEKLLLASFHGDTNGLLTIPVVSAVRDYAMELQRGRKLLFGMDANTYESPKTDQQGVTAFAQFYTSKGINSCYGPTPNPKNYTTFHARTYLQPQLNKAIRFAEKDVKGDKNPKDFIVFFEDDFRVRWTQKDNTGKGKYVEGMVFPTLAFPSDHGITATSLAAGGDTVKSIRRRRNA